MIISVIEDWAFFVTERILLRKVQGYLSYSNTPELRSFPLHMFYSISSTFLLHFLIVSEPVPPTRPCGGN